MEDGQPPITSDDVAARAGVSRWTVARAFKKDASISAKTRAKVMEAASELGYVPDLLAASLAGDRSNLIALLVDDFENPHKLVMLERLTRILRAEGIETLLINMLGAADAPGALLAASQRRVDAAVVIGTQFDEATLRAALGARRVKQLIIFARASRLPNTMSICCDDIGAMQELTDHVIARGYRRPLFLAGPDTESTRLMRKETFLRRWSEKVGGAEPPVIHVSQYAMAAAHSGLLEGLKGQELPDVILCENDIVAMGAMSAIRHGLGLRIPQDIAVTGFDDIPLAADPGFDLTTYRQPIDEMAHALLRALRGPKSSQLDVFLPGQAILRGTT